jgi:enolase
VRDVALTCHLRPAPVAHRDVNLQCNTDEFIQKRDVCMEAVPDIPMTRDVSIGVALDVAPDKHFRDVGTHVNFDYKPEIRQRDVGIMFAPEPVEKMDRASNTKQIQTKDFGVFANTM